MDKNTLGFLIPLMERMIRIEQLQIVSVRDFIRRFEMLQQTTKMRADIDKMDNHKDAANLREKLDAVDGKYLKETAAIDRQLFDAMARMKSNHEQQEAILEKLKASLKA